MSNKKAEFISKQTSVLNKIISSYFSDIAVRGTEQGFRFNVDEINNKQIGVLYYLAFDLNCDVSVKRSGAGLVVIVNI